MDIRITDPSDSKEIIIEEGAELQISKPSSLANSSEVVDELTKQQIRAITLENDNKEIENNAKEDNRLAKKAYSQKLFTYVVCFTIAAFIITAGEHWLYIPSGVIIAMWGYGMLHAVNGVIKNHLQFK